MPEHIYLGTVSKQLRGNIEDAKTLEREARAKVGYLFDSMIKGQTFKTGSWNLKDGRKIMAFVWNDMLGKRATVRLTGVGGEAVKVAEYLMEHGWVFTDLVDIENPLDNIVTMYPWDDLRTYYSSAGRRVLLYMDVYEDRTFNFRISPTLNEDNGYESLNKRTWNDLAPTYYSGLTRLLIQSWSAFGRQQTDFFNELIALLPNLPDEINFYVDNPDPTKIGLVRSPEGEYWFVVADAGYRTVESVYGFYGGVYAFKLRQPAGIVELHNFVKAERKLDPGDRTISDFDVRLADAFVVGYSRLSLSNEAPEYVILATSGTPELQSVFSPPTLSITPAYNRPEIGMSERPGGWGWCWRYQKRGASDEFVSGAVIVVQKPNYPKAQSTGETNFSYSITTRMSTMSLLWDENDIPSAEFVVGDDQAFNACRVGSFVESHWGASGEVGVDPEADKLQIGYMGLDYLQGYIEQTGTFSVDGKGDITVNPSTGPYVLSAWYDPSGDLQTVEWHPTEVLTSETVGVATTKTISPSCYTVGGEGNTGLVLTDYREQEEIENPPGTPFTRLLYEIEYPNREILLFTTSPGFVFLLRDFRNKYYYSNYPTGSEYDYYADQVAATSHLFSDGSTIGELDFTTGSTFMSILMDWDIHWDYLHNNIADRPPLPDDIMLHRASHGGLSLTEGMTYPITEVPDEIFTDTYRYKDQGFSTGFWVGGA